MHQPEGLNELARQIYADTSNFDIKISNVAFKGDPIDAKKLLQMQTGLKDLYQRTEIVEADKSLNRGNKELVLLMRFHVFSLFEQTRRIAVQLGEKAMVQDTLSEPTF
jgi:hypothetical protein